MAPGGASWREKAKDPRQELKVSERHTSNEFFCYESYQRRGRPLVTAGAIQKVLASLAAC